MTVTSDTQNDLHSIESDIDAVKFIEQRRQMLQRISNLVNAVQRLTSSLDILLTSTGLNANIADKTFGLLDYLDDKQKSLTTAKIEIRLEALDNGVRDQLSKILSSLHDKESIEKSMASDGGEEVSDPLEIVSEFRRKVRLSMAYRLLMFERGAEPKPICLDVGPELIKGCMQRLEQQEAFYKAKLMDDMEQFRQDVTTLLGNQSISGKLKSVLKKAVTQLKEGVESIKNNRSLDVLPAVLDVSELADIKDSDGHDIVEKEEVADDSGASSKASTNGFFGTLNKWLNSPADVSWKDAKKK